LVATVDGMRFGASAPAVFARPNRKFFGSKRGTTWLNAINDQWVGRGAKVVSGTVRDSLHMVDVIFGRPRPPQRNEAILCFLAGVTTGSTEGTVQALDAATGLLCRLRSAIGLEFVPDLTSD
jgi:hypothetical protein